MAYVYIVLAHVPRSFSDLEHRDKSLESDPGAD